MAGPFRIRVATAPDIPALEVLIAVSVNGLQAADYSPEQRAGALEAVFTVDTQLIADETYFVVENGAGEMVACGGWSKRKTLFGGDRADVREPELLDPRIDSARIRAFFVHPDWARRGIGSLLLEACESAARAAGFRHFEMGATLTGERLYRLRGYAALERIEVPLPNGARLPVIRMRKDAEL